MVDLYKHDCFGGALYRGLNDYLSYVGAPYYKYSTMGPQNPILIIKAEGLRVSSSSDQVSGV